MKLFTYDEIISLRAARISGWFMWEMCEHFRTHTRDEIMEALDAIWRHESGHDALRHVNHVLGMQEARVPLINGREAWKVVPDRNRTSYAARF